MVHGCGFFRFRKCLLAVSCGLHNLCLYVFVRTRTQAAQAARRVDDEENDEDASSGNDDAGDQDDYDDEDDGARADPPSPRSGGGPRRRRKGPTNDSDSDGDGDVKGKGDDDEDEWKTLQQERGEKFKFDGQKKSPEVHAPFYPDVSRLVLDDSLIMARIIVSSNTSMYPG